MEKFRAREICPWLSGNIAIRAVCWDGKYFHQNAIRYGRDINWVPAEHPVSSAAVLYGRRGHFVGFFFAKVSDCFEFVCKVLPWRSNLWIPLSLRCIIEKGQLYCRHFCHLELQKCWHFRGLLGVRCYKFWWLHRGCASASCWAGGGVAAIFSLTVHCNVLGIILFPIQSCNSMLSLRFQGLPHNIAL